MDIRAHDRGAEEPVSEGKEYEIILNPGCSANNSVLSAGINGKQPQCLTKYVGMQRENNIGGNKMILKVAVPQQFKTAGRT